MTTASTRRSFLAASLAAAAPSQTRRPPNIVLVLIDDYGWRDLGCYGSSYYETPNLDRFARESVRFTNGYAACPVCSPTRASVLTGQYPVRSGVTDWIAGRKQWPAARALCPRTRTELPLDHVTLAEALKPAGYASASIGKWHLGGEGFSPVEQGFDRNIGGTSAGSPRSWWPPYNIAGLTHPPPQENEYLADYLTRRAETFIEENKDRPFFLYLPHYSVHIPLGAPESLVEKYRHKATGGSAQGDPVYGAMVEAMDAAFGRLMNKLDALGLAENTLVFFLADNGGLRYEGSSKKYVTNNAPLRAGKGHLYEGGIRVPFMIRWKGRIAPAVRDVPVCSTDLFPTSLAAAGVKIPAHLDGADLLPLLTRGRAPQRDAIYWHYPHYSNQGGVPGGAIRSGPWKLIEFYEDNRLELYNIEADPGERTNLARREAKRAAALRARLNRWRRETRAIMPTPNPNYDPAKADQGLTGAESATPPA
ncbi:MAG: sulfatase [Bryobacterales bacterium]|nr:sulfatase [Bryobacterales bacterium]